MQILIDSREQKPLKFKQFPYVEEIRVGTLTVGDYGCCFKNGHCPPFFFERKSKGDLFGTMGKGYERFKKKITLARELNLTLILIIECGLNSVLRGHSYKKGGKTYRSELKGDSLLKKLFTLYIRYGLKPVFCEDREAMERYIYEFYTAVGREYLLKKK